MTAPRARRAALAALAALAAGTGLAALAGLGGCGVKITVPRPEGLFSTGAYYLEDSWIEEQPVQLAVVSNSLFVLSSAGQMVKYNLNHAPLDTLGGLQNPTAFCRDDDSQLLFIWEQALKRVIVIEVADLDTFDVCAPLPAVQAVSAMSACDAGIAVEPGARTFLYLSDPAAGVVHRFAYADGSGQLAAYGVLARSDGEGARFVHVPAGMAVDAQNRLLICDADTARNWAIRFDSTPDPTDVLPLWQGQQPQRGTAVTFGAPTCNPPAAVDYTLGYAAACGQTDWQGRRSAEEGEFDQPLALAVDGAGRIYVADTGNDRVQIFTAAGEYEMLYGSAERTPAPASIGVIDWRTGAGADAVNYGAYLFVLTTGTGEVRKLISGEQYQYINKEPPPAP